MMMIDNDNDNDVDNDNGDGHGDDDDDDDKNANEMHVNDDAHWLLLQVYYDGSYVAIDFKATLNTFVLFSVTISTTFIILNKRSRWYLAFQCFL